MNASGNKFRKTMIFYAMMSAVSLLGTAEAAEYTCGDITGMETGLDAVKTQTEGVMSYEFAVGDKVTGTAYTGIYINDYNPNEAAITGMKISNLDMTIADGDNGVSIFTPMRRVELKNSALAIVGQYLVTGINLTDKGADLHLLGSNRFDVKGLEAVGLSSKEISGAANVTAENIVLGANGNLTASGIRLYNGEGGSTALASLTADSLDINAKVAGESGFGWGKAVGIQVSNASTISSKQTVIQTEFVQSAESCYTYGLELSDGADVSLGDGRISAKGSSDDPTHYVHGVYLSGSATLELGNMQVSAVTEATTSDHAHTVGLYQTAGSITMERGSIEAKAPVSGSASVVAGAHVTGVDSVLTLGSDAGVVDVTVTDENGKFTGEGIGVFQGKLNYAGGLVEAGEALIASQGARATVNGDAQFVGARTGVRVDATSQVTIANKAVAKATSTQNQGHIAINNAEYQAGIIKDSAAGSWTLTAGKLHFGRSAAEPAPVQLGSITADSASEMHFDTSNGQIYKVDSLNGSGFTVGLSDVVESGISVGSNMSADVTVIPDAGNGDRFKDEQAFAEAAAKSVTTGTGENKKTVVTKVAAAEGDLFGGFTADVGADGTVTLDKETENKKLAAYRSVQGLSNFLWRHDMNDLTKRMGELRDAPEGIGAWARLYGSEQEYGAVVKSTNNSVQVGLDTDVGSGWKAGAAFTYTEGDSDYANGSADNESWGFGLYGSWLADDGKFLDVIAKYTRMENDFELGNMAGGVNNNALSVSAEVGWNVKLAHGLFVEPQFEATWGRVSGETFTTSNGVTIAQEDFDSFILRSGLRGGWVLPNKMGNIYARASLAHDCAGEAKSVATKNLGRVEFNDDLGGTWAEYGVGANLNINETTYAYFDFERTSGGEVKENWRWNVGVRHTF